MFERGGGRGGWGKGVGSKGEWWCRRGSGGGKGRSVRGKNEGEGGSEEEKGGLVRAGETGDDTAVVGLGGCGGREGVEAGGGVCVSGGEDEDGEASESRGVRAREWWVCRLVSGTGGIGVVEWAGSRKERGGVVGRGGKKRNQGGGRGEGVWAGGGRGSSPSNGTERTGDGVQGGGGSGGSGNGVVGRGCGRGGDQETGSVGWEGTKWVVRVREGEGEKEGREGEKVSVEKGAGKWGSGVGGPVEGGEYKEEGQGGCREGQVGEEVWWG
ncbi:hypothetical protein Tco_0991238 [Tanacetum coccineum]|uniref:Uncharacterized protein n=1 Tax=Tanacetum coccineum TaxID=301880 RepID=A0ABQ5EZC0_9ASTR